MITFGAPLGLSLLALLAVPVVLHVLHRTRWLAVSWPAMLLIRDVATRRGTRLTLQDLLLLGLRLLLLIALALTASRPRWLAPNEETTERRGRVAAVLLVDDGVAAGARVSSASSLGSDERTVNELQNALGSAYLATLTAGDEISLIANSQRDAPAADPLYDVATADRQLHALRPTATASDVPGLIAAGLRQLDRHRNRDAELVLLATGCTAGAALDDVARWSDLRERLAQGRWSGWRRPRVLLLVPEQTIATDWAVSAIEVDQPLLLPGVPVGVRVRLTRSGEAAIPAGLTLRLAIDGRMVDEKPVPPFGDHLMAQVVGFSQVFGEAGGHLLEARLIGAADPLELDDQRTLAIEVAERVPVALIEAEPGELALVAAALDPAEGTDPSAPFAPRAITAANLSSETLAQVRAVVIGDVGVLEPPAITALERFIAGGGGVLFTVGPRTVPELANRAWFRGGDGLLAAALTTVPATADKPRIRHPRPAPGLPSALSGFADDSAAWQAAEIRQVATVQPGNWESLVELDDGTPLVLSAHRGQGLTAMCLIPLDDRWSDLPWRALWVPLMRGLIGSLAATVQPPRNLSPGDMLIWPCPLPTSGQGVGVGVGLAADPFRAVLTDPRGALATLRPGGWDASPALLAGPLAHCGAWRLAPVAAHDGPPVTYAVAPAPAGLDLSALAIERLRRQIVDTGCTVQLVRTPATFAQNRAGTAIREYELTAWGAALALLLLLVELLCARLLDPPTRRIAP